VRMVSNWQCRWARMCIAPVIPHPGHCATPFAAKGKKEPRSRAGIPVRLRLCGRSVGAEAVTHLQEVGTPVHIPYRAVVRSAAAVRIRDVKRRHVVEDVVHKYGELQLG